MKKIENSCEQDSNTIVRQRVCFTYSTDSLFGGRFAFLSFQVAHRTRGFIMTNPCFILIYFSHWPPLPLPSSPHWFTSPPGASSSCFRAIRLSRFRMREKEKDLLLCLSVPLLFSCTHASRVDSAMPLLANS